MNINLHIERLVLDGISVSDGGGPHVQAAIETELARLLAVGGVSAAFHTGQAVPSVRGGDLHLTAGGSHAELGRHIAGALYGGIGK